MFKSLLLPVVLLGLTAARPAPLPAPISVVAPPAVAADPANRLMLELSNGGRVVVQLRPDIAPRTVLRIQTLAQQHFYDGLIFHRVIPGFMAQGGDPKGTGEGGSSLPDLKAEFSEMPHLRGTVSLARAQGEDSGNSQFYIMFSPKASLDHKYTVFGRVIEGMAAVDSIAPGEPPEQPTRIVHATIGAPVAAAEAPAVAAAPPTPAVPAPVAATPPAAAEAPVAR